MMNENEVIKALECCCDDKNRCAERPYDVIGCITDNNENSLLKDTLALINRQRAEIEGHVQDIRNKTSEAYTAGYKKGAKEFAKRLDDLLNNEGGCDSEPGTWARGGDDA